MRKHSIVIFGLLIFLCTLVSGSSFESTGPPVPPAVPMPLLGSNHPVEWWFVFKLNSAAFPGCGAATSRTCPFGGTVQNYHSSFGQQYVFASNEFPKLKQGSGCTGDTESDPVGATFSEIYNGSFHYVIWNDQFYKDPEIQGCAESCGGPWGHSKGLLAWNDAGNGLVMQVTTPSWPASGSKAHPRKTDGNTLGCVKDNNVLVSQHFFALHLNKADVVTVLKALLNASVVTDPSNLQIVSNGGPPDIQQLVGGLGKKSSSTAVLATTLSGGVQLISKPSKLNVPPWQMVSSLLGSIPLRTATWWASPFIPTTTATTQVKCWDTSLAKPGAVEIATTGSWQGKTIGLTGGGSADHNHAKIGVALSSNKSLAIFGDMNQQGTLSGENCKSSQNGRGGLFYVVSNHDLSESIRQLIAGNTAPANTATAVRPRRSVAHH